jgi:hypothetical protein
MTPSTGGFPVPFNRTAAVGVPQQFYLFDELAGERSAGLDYRRASIGMKGCRLTGALAANRGWKRRFDEPILLPRGRQLVTLEDAGTYITKLPKAEHEAAKWQAAMEALILVATSGGPTMFARIGIMRALNRGHVREFNPDRKEHHWGRRKLKRDM